MLSYFTLEKEVMEVGRTYFWNSGSKKIQHGSIQKTVPAGLNSQQEKLGTMTK